MGGHCAQVNSDLPLGLCLEDMIDFLPKWPTLADTGFLSTPVLHRRHTVRTCAVVALVCYTREPVLCVDHHFSYSFYLGSVYQSLLF